ncbi:hypothetical protein M433DRAFT_131498 [Acidomyces richmondensis BFW]|nr:MAG: hypothetical protein FE78DRAFT_33772 [Acidomyces sp. 'richmondensis']KYG49165.1 hypothetical protein M433DRAFT_131498 [Acidomyces richmondensis BFW]
MSTASPSDLQSRPTYTFFRSNSTITTTGGEGFTTAIPPLPETDEFCVYGTIHAYPEHADALEAVYAQTTARANSAEEPGTVYYCICRDGDDSTMFHMFERYKGQRGFDAHNAQPIIKKLVEEDGYIRGVKARFAIPGLRSDEEQRKQWAHEALVENGEKGK